VTSHNRQVRACGLDTLTRPHLHALRTAVSVSLSVLPGRVSQKRNHKSTNLAETGAGDSKIFSKVKLADLRPQFLFYVHEILHIGSGAEKQDRICLG